MDEKELIKQLHDLKSEMYEVYEANYPDRKEEAAPITDGVYNVKEYLNSNVKILWLLKEPYCEGDGTGGGWNLAEEAEKHSWFFPLVKNPTFITMAYTSYCLLENKFYDEPGVPWLNENNDAVNKAMLKIAHININKMPGWTRSTWSGVANQYPVWKAIIFKQIEAINPEIIICGNTFSILQDDLSVDELNRVEVKPEISFISYAYGSKLIIDAYHPAQTQITRETYVDSIKTLVDRWKASKS